MDLYRNAMSPLLGNKSRPSGLRKLSTIFMLGAASLGLFLTANANAQSREIGPQFNFAEIAVATPELSTLVALASKCDLVVFLADQNTSGTLFAPTNDAFRKLLGDGPLPETCSEDLKDILLTQVALTNLPSSRIGKSAAYKTYLFGDELFVKAENNTVKVNQSATVVKADLAATNGTIHIIDTVLMPDKFGTIVDALSKREEFNALVKAAVASNLATTLAIAPNITVFAPLNEAFSEVGSLSVPNLSKVLLNHVLGNRVRSEQLVKGYQQVQSLNEEPITIFGNNSGFTIFGSGQTPLSAGRIIATDIGTKNGVIHTISKVLIPANIK